MCNTHNEDNLSSDMVFRSGVLIYLFIYLFFFIIIFRYAIAYLRTGSYAPVGDNGEPFWIYWKLLFTEQ